MKIADKSVAILDPDRKDFDIKNSDIKGLDTS